MLSGQATPVRNRDLLFRGLRVYGFWPMPWLDQSSPEHIMSVMGELMPLMATGKMVSPVEATYDLAQAREAILHATRPGRQGKVILTG